MSKYDEWSDWNDDLILAASEGDLYKVISLIDEHDTAGGYDPYGSKDDALTDACEQGQIEVVKYLYDHGVDIHTGDNSPIKEASYNDQAEVLEFLIEKYNKNRPLKKNHVNEIKSIIDKKYYPLIKKVVLASNKQIDVSQMIEPYL